MPWPPVHLRDDVPTPLMPKKPGSSFSQLTAIEKDRLLAGRAYLRPPTAAIHLHISSKLFEADAIYHSDNLPAAEALCANN